MWRDGRAPDGVVVSDRYVLCLCVCVRMFCMHTHSSHRRSLSPSRPPSYNQGLFLLAASERFHWISEEEAREQADVAARVVDGIVTRMTVNGKGQILMERNSSVSSQDGWCASVTDDQDVRSDQG